MKARLIKQKVSRCKDCLGAVLGRNPHHKDVWCPRGLKWVNEDKIDPRCPLPEWNDEE